MHLIIIQPPVGIKQGGGNLLRSKLVHMKEYLQKYCLKHSIPYVEVSRNAKNGETKRQKINYEANNDRNLTKLNTHCLDLYQNEV